MLTYSNSFYRNSGDTHQAANVAVDLMHSVALGSLPSHNVVQREVDTSPSTDKMAHEASNSTNEGMSKNETAYLLCANHASLISIR